jgi:predicted permease
MRPSHWIYTIPLRLRSLFRRNTVDAELSEELQDHLDHLIERNRSDGMSEADARHAAMRAMDGMSQRMEECRDTRRVRFIEDFFKDLHYAARTLLRSPIFALTAVLSLALGIGANTAIFTALDAMLWRPLPVEKPEELVSVGRILPNGRQSTVFPARLRAELQRSGAFTDTIGISEDGLSFAYDGRAERIMGSAVTPNYFTFLGVKTILGDPFSTGVREGHWAAEAVLGYRFWKNRFGGDPTVIGRVIHLNAYQFTIVGVSEAAYYDENRGLDPELRVPLMPAGQSLKEMQLISDSEDVWLHTMARLKPGVSRAQASSISDRHYQDFLRTSKPAAEGRSVGRAQVVPGAGGYTQYLDDFETPLFVVFGLVGGVLLIACANVANMLLARATARQRELALRCSLGAGRSRLIRQMLAESLMLATIGGALGIGFAYWSGPLLLHFLPRSNITLAVDLHPDTRALAFTFALAILTGILFGLIPALTATRGDLAGTLKADSAGSIGEPRSAAFRRLLVAGQVAFSMVLLIAAGLFVRTASNLRPKDLGVNPDRNLQFMIKPQQEIYSDARMRTMLTELLRRIRETPGVESANLAHPGPFTGVNGDGQPVHVPGHQPINTDQDDVTPGFIQTFGLHLIAGRDFTAADKPGSPLVAVINQKLAGALFGHDNPIGRSFEWDRSGPAHGTYQVIGVVADSIYYNLRGAPRPIAFFTFQGYPPYMPVVHVRTNNPETASMMTAMRRIFDEVDKGFPVFNVKTMSMQIDDAMARERMVADLAAGFGLLALVLASVGLYGILAFSVARRTREIGIRMALGSGSFSVVWLLAKEAFRLVALGCAIGIGAAILTGKLLASSLYGVSPADPATLGACAALMLAIATIAVIFPAWRALRIDPLLALRHD